MRRMHKKINIALISPLIGVFLSSSLAYSSDISHLRVPIVKDDARKKKAADEITKQKNPNQDLPSNPNAKIPKYGDPDFWPGRMGIEQKDLVNLGLMKQGLWTRQWIIDNLFKRFHAAPPEVIALLKKRFAKPMRTHGEILQSHEAVKVFLESMQQGEKEVENVNTIMQLVVEFSSTRKVFYDELKILRDKHYRDRYRYWKQIFEHIYPYPDTTKCLIRLGRMILMLQEIRDLLPDSDSRHILRWKEKINDTLNRREVKAFLDKENFMDIVSRMTTNPYVFAPLEYIQESVPARLRQKIKDIDQKEGDDNEYDFFTTNRQSAVKGLKEWKKLPSFEPGRKEFSELIEQFGDLWLINVPTTNKLKINRSPDEPHLAAKHEFLRQFPDGRMNSPLAEIDYYCRIALMILKGGYKLPNIIQPKGNIKVTSYKNPLLKPKKEARTDALGKFLDLHDEEGADEDKELAEIVPITISLGGNDSALLLSGPNMGGKTATARGIGLAVVLTQMGFPLPDDNPEIAVFKNIYTIFPQPEQLQAGYGYFGMLIKQFTELIEKAEAGDLVILDEVPTGTDYNELVAIATVLIEDLINTGATVIVTGHLKKAFELVAERTGQKPFMHTVTQEDGRFIPDFGLAPGIAKHSHAIELMKNVNFPEDIIKLAEAYYAVITQKEAPSIIPSVLDVKDKERWVRSTSEPEEELSDAGMIKSVANNLYPEESFAFEKTHEVLIKTLISPITLRLKEDSSDKAKVEDGKSGIEGIDEQMYFTKFFISQGEEYLSGLTELLRDFKEIRGRRVWFQPKYNQDENAKKIQQAEVFLNKIISYIDKMKDEEEIANMIEAFKKLIKEEIPKLQKEFVEKDISELKEKELETLQTVWQHQWGQFLNDIMMGVGGFDEKLEIQGTQGIMFLDKYAGIAKGVIKWELKPTKYSRTPNTFSLKNSKPFFPHRLWAETPFIEDAKEQSFEINPKKPVLVLTGPNSSGKTVMMFNSRMNALFATHGFYVSGDFEMSLFDNINTFFGGMNEITAGESYFLNIIGKYADIINSVTPNSLVILDELHGTDNFELAAIQVAVLHYLRSLNCTVIFNTHIRDGLKIADEKVGLDFWKTDVKYIAKENKVKPFYTLSPDPNLEAKSYGLPIASEWLSTSQIARATEILSTLSEDL